MYFLKRNIAVLSFLFVISSSHAAFAHGNHHLDSKEALVNHISKHVEQLKSFLSQKTVSKDRMAQQYIEILEHVEEYQRWVAVRGSEDLGKEFISSPDQSNKLLKQAALNYDFHAAAAGMEGALPALTAGLREGVN